MEKLKGIDSISPPDKGDDKEYIGLAVVYPRGFQNVPFEPAALLDKTQLKKKVQSCVRLCWSTPQEIYDQVVSKAKPKNNHRQIIAGMLIATAQELDQIVTYTGENAIKIIISGRPDYRAHVDIGTTDKADLCIADNKEKDSIRTIRQKLIDQFISCSCQNNTQEVNFWPQLSTSSSWVRTKNSSHFVPFLGDIC